MVFSDLPLRNNVQYYINMRLVNGLGYMSTASSTPFLVDLTPPTPGNVVSVTSDDITVVPCEELTVGGLECIESANGSNHRSDRHSHTHILPYCHTTIRSIQCGGPFNTVHGHFHDCPSHRVIVDAPDSALVFNGPTPLRDAMYTSANNYITGNIDIIYSRKCMCTISSQHT